MSSTGKVNGLQFKMILHSPELHDDDPHARDAMNAQIRAHDAHGV